MNQSSNDLNNGNRLTLDEELLYDIKKMSKHLKTKKAKKMKKTLENKFDYN